MDDIFFISKCNIGKLNLFCIAIGLYNFYPTIKFVMNYSQQGVNCLDITVYIKNNLIHAKLHI